MDMYKWPEAQVGNEDIARICAWYESIDTNAISSSFVMARKPDRRGAVLVRIVYAAADNGRRYLADIAILPSGRLELWAN